MQVVMLLGISSVTLAAFLFSMICFYKDFFLMCVYRFGVFLFALETILLIQKLYKPNIKIYWYGIAFVIAIILICFIYPKFLELGYATHIMSSAGLVFGGELFIIQIISEIKKMPLILIPKVGLLFVACFFIAVVLATLILFKSKAVKNNIKGVKWENNNFLKKTPLILLFYVIGIFGILVIKYFMIQIKIPTWLVFVMPLLYAMLHLFLLQIIKWKN